MSSKLKIFLFIIYLHSSEKLFSQQKEDVIFENILESLVENYEEDIDYTELLERLNHYIKKPLNLNKASQEQLKELTFLNPIQINNLLEHIQTNGKLIDRLELQSIAGFDLETINLLLLFTSINGNYGLEQLNFSNLLKKGNNDIITRFGRVLESQKGYDNPLEENRSRYLGNPYKILTRYRFSYEDKIFFSLNVDKDAGEKFLNENKPDFLSTSLYIKNISRFKKIVFGDFSLQFGQGLTMWSGLSYGKSADQFSLAKQDLGLRPYTSFNEFSYLRGFATQINFGKLDFIPFISFKKVDASTEQDDEGIKVLSLQQSGLHRTENELKNKNSVHQFIAGGNLEYKYNRLSIGLNTYHSIYNSPFKSSETPYQYFNFEGKELTNFGLNYSYSIHNIYFFGEIAKTLNYGSAYLNGLMASISPTLSLILLHRNYQRNYHSFFNQAISESSQSNNENGFYSGFHYKSGRKYDFSFYTDVFKFPWLKYRIDAPSTGYEIFSQFTYSLNKTTKFIFRYRLKEKQQNDSQNTAFNFLEDVVKQNYRIELQYKINENITLKNRAEMVQFKKIEPQSFGFLAYQDINYHPFNSSFSGSIRFTLFETEGFDTRIYSYENDVLYGYSIPALQNRGIRFYVNGRYTLKKGLDFWLKYSQTKYNNLEEIGSGLELIEGNKKSEIRIQLRYQF
jgi:hypothetical protein